MKKGYVYTIFFMILLSAFFSAIIGLADSYYRDTIIENDNFRIKKSVLLSVNIFFKSRDETNDFFENHIEFIESNELSYYRYYDEDDSKALIYPFSGPGLWGTIQGFLSITPDLKEIVGIDFTDHNETPGLGGRIDEEWFKGQFKNIRYRNFNELRFGDETGLDAISGATNTSTAVLGILNELLYENPPFTDSESEAEK